MIRFGLRGLRAAILQLAAVAGLMLALVGTATAATPESVRVMRGLLSSTVQVIVEREGGSRRTGSSIVLATDATTRKTILLTAAHVVAPGISQKVSAMTPLRRDGRPAEVLAVDHDVDLAIVEVADIEVTPVDFAVQGMLGEEVWVAAFPWGGRISVVGGVISQIIWRTTDTSAEIPLSGPVTLIDATVSHGMSGGGVFNRESGALLGIVRSYRTVQLTLPGEPERAITFPVGGETTIVPTLRILCFLADSGHRELVPASLRSSLTGDACSSKE